MGGDEERGPYDGLYTPAELRALRRGAAPRGVDAEVEAARVVVMRLIASGQAEERPDLVIRAVDAVVRAARVRHQLDGGRAGNVLEATDRILAELGMGDE